MFYATFGLPGRPADRLENLKVEITNGQPPILEVTTPVLLPTGTVWTTMAGVSVTDPEDDQAGRPLVIHASGRVDTNVEGLYKVTYSVTDADFNTASRTRLVAVGDFVVGGGFLLRAEGFSANVMDISGERSELILKTGAKAWTSEGVDAEVEVKTDGGYRKAGGDYQIVVGVKEQMAEPTRAVFAQISAKTHTVQFHGNGAASLPGPRSVQLTQPETRLQSFPSDPGRTGYAFLGWNTEKLSGGSWMKTGAVVTSDLTLYARWQINRYNLTFDVNGGKRRNPASQKVQYKGLAKAPAGPVHGDLNMKFSGWNTRKDGKGTGWNFSRSRMPARDVILYAIWKKTAPAKIKEKIVTKTKPIYVTRTWYNTIEKQVLTTVPAIWMVDADVSPPDLGEESRIPDPKTPTDASSAAGSTWSLINLLLMLIGCMMTILCLAILAFRQKRSARDDGEFSNKNLAGMALAAVATLANILIYMITQDRFATPMILTDGATFGTAAVFAVIITGLIASFWQFGDGEGKEA